MNLSQKLIVGAKEAYAWTMLLKLTDEQWARIRDHFPEDSIPPSRPGRRPVPVREVLNAALWAMALLGASLANAVIDFDAAGGATSPVGTVIYSAEGLASDATRRMATSGADAGFYAISASSSLLHARKNLSQLAVYRLGQTGSGNSSNNAVWIRVQGSGGLKLFRDPGLSVSGGCFVGLTANGDLSGNGVYLYKIDKDEAPFSTTAACTDATPFPTPYSVDGRGPHVIVPLGRKNDFTQDDVDPATATTAISGGAGMLTISAYTGAIAAFRGEAGGSRLFADTVTAVNTSSSIAVTIEQASAPAIADVETGFTKFAGASPNSATLGSVTARMARGTAGHLMPDGSLAANNVANLIGADSKVQINSEQGFAFGTFKLGGTTLSPVAPAGVTLGVSATCSKPGAGVTLTSCSAPLKAGAQNLTMDVIEPGDNERAPAIPEATFEAVVIFSDDDNRALNGALPDDVGPTAFGWIRGLDEPEPDPPEEPAPPSPPGAGPGPEPDPDPSDPGPEPNPDPPADGDLAGRIAALEARLAELTRRQALDADESREADAVHQRRIEDAAAERQSLDERLDAIEEDMPPRRLRIPVLAPPSEPSEE